MFLVLLAGLALMNQSRTEPLATWDNAFADFLAMNSPRQATSAPVTLVGINDSSLVNHPWPWNPLEFSVFFKSALPLKPEVLGIDQVLNWERAIILPEDQNPKLAQYEKILRGNILRSPKMLLGSKLGIPEDPQVIPPLQEVPLFRNVRGSLSEVPEFTAVESEPSEAYRLSSTIGFTNLPPGRRHFNSVPLLLRYRGQVTPAFPLQAVLLWAELTPDDVTVQVGSFIDVGKKFHIPIDQAGRMRVDFGAPFGSLGFVDLAFASEQKEAGLKPDRSHRRDHRQRRPALPHRQGGPHHPARRAAQRLAGRTFRRRHRHHSKPVLHSSRAGLGDVRRHRGLHVAELPHPAHEKDESDPARRARFGRLHARRARGLRPVAGVASGRRPHRHRRRLRALPRRHPRLLREAETPGHLVGGGGSSS